MKPFEGPKKAPDQVPQVPDIPMKEAGKVVFPVRSEEEVQDRIRRMRIEAQSMVSAPTTVEDYRQVMWETYQDLQRKVAEADRVLEKLQAKKKSPLASSVFGAQPTKSTDERLQETLDEKRVWQESAQAIWVGMTAWGQQQKPHQGFFDQVQARIAQVQVEEKERFAQSKAFPSDESALQVWAKVAREMKTLQDFLQVLQHSSR